MSDKVKKEIEWLLSLDNKGKYQFLDRMRSDCTYYLSGHRNDKNLYGGNVTDHITYMKALWNSFIQDEKPEWLTMEQIEAFEREMKESEAKKYEYGYFSSEHKNIQCI